jgi:hypothetical protein
VATAPGLDDADRQQGRLESEAEQLREKNCRRFTAFGPADR